MGKTTKVKIVQIIMNNTVVDAKKCTRCEAVRALDEFYISKKGSGGRQSVCTKCLKKTPIQRVKIVQINVDGQMLDAKKCAMCKDVKPLNKFNKGTSAGGRYHTCTDCRKKYREENRDELTRKRREHYARIKDTQEYKEKEKRRREQRKAWQSDYYKKWLEKNKERASDYKKQWYRENEKRVRERVKIWSENNKKRIRENFLNWYKENKNKIIENSNKWREKNPKRYKATRIATKQRRRAKERLLISDFTLSDFEKLMDHFDKSCVFTKSEEDLHLDHFIPVSWGHGGSYIGNLYPLSDKLNFNKLNKNPFEWIKETDVQEQIDKKDWDKLIQYLAKQNNLSVDEFSEFVYWCEANKRTVEQIEADGDKTSIELWKESKALQ